MDLTLADGLRRINRKTSLVFMIDRGGLVVTIREHVKKRHEADDEGYFFGAERVDHLKLEARKRDFTFIVDEPAERDGTDQGPNPLAKFIAVAAACLVNQFLADAIYRGVKLDDIALTARGRFDATSEAPSQRSSTI